MVYKIIGADQQEYGPVTAEEMRQWILEKRVDQNTLIHVEGSADWKPLSSYPELVALLTSGSLEPSLSGGSEFIPPVPVSAADLEALIQRRGVHVNIFSCITRGWKLVIDNFFLSIGATWLILLVLTVASSLCPGLQIVVEGILFGGLYWCLLQMIRKKEVDIGEAFAGFSRETMQLFLGGVVKSILVFLPPVLLAAPFTLSFFVKVGQASLTSQQLTPEQIAPMVGPWFFLGLLILVLGIFLLNALWLFAYPLIIDKGLGFWDAMEMSRKVVMKAFLPMIGLLIMLFVVQMLGFMACCVGIFIAVPVMIAATAYAYEDIFGAEITPKA
jgi:uncharacterized membrane protein